jgi:hypothetical protein
MNLAATHFRYKICEQCEVLNKTSVSGPCRAVEYQQKLALIAWLRLLLAATYIKVVRINDLDESELHS